MRRIFLFLFLLFLFFAHQAQAQENAVNGAEWLEKYMQKQESSVTSTDEQKQHSQEKGWRSLEEKAYLLFKQGLYEDAVIAEKESIALATGEFGEESYQRAISLGNLAALYDIMKKEQLAEDFYIQAREILNKLRMGIPAGIQREVFFMLLEEKKAKRGW